MSESRLLQFPIAGMDCAECTEHVRHAIAALPGVVSVDVFLTSEKAAVRLDPSQVSLDAIRGAVEGAGYRVAAPVPASAVEASGRSLTRQLGLLLAALFGVVLFVAVVGEGLGVFERTAERVPWPVWLALIVIAGYPVFRNVVRATLHRQIISHTLMTIGVLAAIAVGQWVTALVVVFFMRVGDTVEHFTTDRARRSLKSLTALAPRTARVLREDVEVELPVDQVRPGDTAIVRPGEQIPADGEVLDGHATVDQAAITGESLPVEAGPGSRVYAATIARLGHLRVRVTHAGADSTYGRVIRLVEEAEANRADIQRTADRFSAYFLPIVLGIAVLTLVLSRDPLATAAVLVVACSCSIALATPIAVLASVGAAARHGLLIKGGRYLELLDRADVLLVDKTGTVTLGRPEITDVLVADSLWQMANCRWQIADGKLWAPGETDAGSGVEASAGVSGPQVRPAKASTLERIPGDLVRTHDETAAGSGVEASAGFSGQQVRPAKASTPESIAGGLDLEAELLRLVASAERYSEHPLAEAVRAAARGRGLALAEPGGFIAEPGVGVRAVVDGIPVAVGSRRLAPDLTGFAGESAQRLDETQNLSGLEAQGKTLLFVTLDGQLAGVLAAADTRRPEVPAALADLRRLGIRQIEILTGDNERAAQTLAAELGVSCRANLLPEDKIRIVKEYQAQGRTVVMVGDGVNDAPALAQADVGIAMAAAGSDIAIEAAHVAVMRDDWSLVPEVFRIAHRTMRVVRMNLGLTAAYNVAGLTLAAFGILPPILAAAAQSLPDLGILGNSSRLLRQK
jgi:Cd2+/Zn2+-exporting ATPase/Cu+-exporting ATPase